MSKSIKEAISIDTFPEVKHLGGAAAVIIADNDWFKGRRHANQHSKYMIYGEIKINHHPFSRSKMKMIKNSLSFYLPS